MQFERAVWYKHCYMLQVSTNQSRRQPTLCLLCFLLAHCIRLVTARSATIDLEDWRAYMNLPAFNMRQTALP